MERALLALCALALNAVLAGPRRLTGALHLARLPQAAVSLLRQAERKLNRERRSPAERELRGTLLAMAVLITGIAAGWLCGALLRHNLRFGELLILTACLPVRPLWDRAAQMRKALHAGNLPLAHDALAGTPWRHHALLDEYGLGRAAVEMLAVQFGEKIIAPVLWYLLAGLPGLLGCKAVTLLQETVSLPPSAEPFGKSTRGLHTLVQYIPSRIAAVLWIAVLLFFPGKQPARALRRITLGIFIAPPQTLPLICAGAALGLSLGGPSSVYSPGTWIGDGAARVGSGEIRRALYGYALMLLLVFVLLGFLM